MSGKNIFYLSAEDFFLQPIYSCIHCRANLAHHADLISKSFQGSQGRAYLFNNVVNVGSLVAEERMLLTGLHYVADIYCECCSFILGWKYERAFEPTQRYKEGKYIIELANLIKDNGWDVDYPRIRPSYRKENRKSFSIDWEASCDNISKSSLSRIICKSQTKSQNNFVRELSQDFQYLFGFYEKNNLKTEHDLITKINVSSSDNDNIVMSEVLNSSQDKNDRPDILRLNSDSDNMDSLQNSFTQSFVDHSFGDKLKLNPDISNLSANESAESSSLNTSYNSTKGLLGASCSYDIKVHKCSKLKSKKLSVDDSTSTAQHMPSFDLSLSGVSGTNCVMSTSHGNQHRHCTRHKHKSRHSSNVVNPQKGSVHRRHMSEMQSGDRIIMRHRSQETSQQVSLHKQ